MAGCTISPLAFTMAMEVIIRASRKTSQHNITWAQMKFKPSKSRSISIVRGKLVDQRFYNEAPIPLVSEQSVKSLGRCTTAFVKAGQLPGRPSARVETTLLDTARDWKMKVDLDQKLIPPEIITTNLRPDLILWSTSQKLLYIVELTVPWESAVDEAYECKCLKYTDIAAEAEQCGWRTQVLPVEVGCRGFVATSTARLLRSMGI
ncbi:hypothetical protein D5F01_LYC12379 [Larimichthys crocea]|uniref:Uncharacterized protein n=1 Tax=Larimichthys crocea TaxID=215358 RepID=A0A6G0IAX8_LARCR|nr:hypothetical protein D5F01_LYC12379 [Larimichthys crocea]